MTQAPSKPKNPQWSTRVGIVALVMLVFYLGTQSLGSDLLPKGTPAPDFSLQVAYGDGSKLTLAQLQGQVVVLDFWSTSCPPCLKTMEELETVAARNKVNGVQVIGIAVGGEDREEIVQFGQQRGVSYPLAAGDDPLANAYRVRVLPTLYVLGRDGRVVESHTGYWDRVGIARAIRAALEQPSPKN